jgi:hypothetical protein|tara:strand:+ start:544 stop:816 length:273 start_codon:yes stop_codon:yes gene_type:complete
MWKFKKATGRKPPQKSWSTEELKIIGWCMTRNIKVSAMPDWKNNASDWLIDVSINNKTYTDPNKYNDDKINDKILEYYKYYYKPNTNNNR